LLETKQEFRKDSPKFPVLIMDSENNPEDLLFVSGIEEAKKLAGVLSFSKLYVLFHPNPVKLKRGFYKAFGKAKDGKERIKIGKKFKVLTEESIKRIETLILDIDSPFTEVYPVWEELRKTLPSLSADVYRTKSGRFRAAISLEYPLLPQKQVRNGRTNYENIKEVLEEIKKFFEKKNLNFDRTCIDRLNHPIWIGRGEELVLEGEKVNFYRLYREVKKNLSSKRPSIHSVKSRKRGSGREDYSPLRKDNRSGNNQSQQVDYSRIQHSFLAWNIFASCLSKKYNSKRFLHVILPIAGTAKVLKIEWEVVEKKLWSILPDRDKKKSKLDFETARKYGRKASYLPFPDKEKKLLEVIRTIAERGELPQQEVIRICYNQRWLQKEITDQLLADGIIKVEEKKLKPGPGRKAKVYSFTVPVEEDYKKAITPLPEKYQELLEKVKSVQIQHLSEKNKVSQESPDSKETKIFSEKNLLIKFFYPPLGDSTSPIGEYKDDSLQSKFKSKRNEGNGSMEAVTDHNELTKFLETVERFRSRENYQELSELFKEAELFEVDLKEVNRLYFRNRQLGKLVGRVVSLFVVREDYVRAKAIVKLTSVQREFVGRYIKLKQV